jgi:poly [ADP-ribose] polymerase
VGISGYHIKNIFTLDIPKVTSRYLPTEAKLGHVRELFHGTKTANMLSISINGLIIPPTGAAHVTGRMFGNGVYGASCSTKALNYAVGYWGGRKNRTSTAYMLIVKFAMGNEYVAHSHLYSGAPKGYDSVWGKAGRSLLNDEFIVYNLNQATITHILELEDK